MTDAVTSDMSDDDATCMTLCSEKTRQADSSRKSQTSAFHRMTVVVKRWKNATGDYSAVVRVQGAQKVWNVEFS